MQDIVHRLNKKNKDNYSMLASNDQVLKNISGILEKKGKALNSFSPDILHHIERFENHNNFDKSVFAFDDDKSLESRRRISKRVRRQQQANSMADHAN